MGSSRTKLMIENYWPSLRSEELEALFKSRKPINSLWQFRDIKSLSSRQVCCTQKLLQYHFWIDYCQWSCWYSATFFPQRSQDDLGAEYSNLLPAVTNGPSTQSSYLRNARPPFVTSILEMHFGRRRPKPRLGQRCSMAEKMLRKLYIIKEML